MRKGIPTILASHPANGEIVRYLADQRPSAHSDATSEMLLAAQGLRDIHSYAPDPASYSYEAVYTSDGVIFAVAVGQSTLLFRIPPDSRALTVESHAKPFPPLGPEWASVPAFRSDIPLADWQKTIRRLMKVAFDSAV